MLPVGVGSEVYVAFADRPDFSADYDVLAVDSAFFDGAAQGFLAFALN